MSETGIETWIAAVAVLAPGLDGWEASRPVLAGHAPYAPTPPTIPPPALLAANERRRTGQVTRLALALAQQASAMHGSAPGALRSLFASANGDGATVDAILTALADPAGAVSPTQFHNSVHNAAAGYWSIGAGSAQPASSIGCHDHTAAAALLQAAAETRTLRQPVLLCLYDCPMPPPLHARRPIGALFGAAFVLTPAPTSTTMARLRLAYTADDTPAATTPPRNPALAALAAANPIARLLRLLEALATATENRAVEDRFTLAFLDGRLDLVLTPC